MWCSIVNYALDLFSTCVRVEKSCCCWEVVMAGKQLKPRAEIRCCFCSASAPAWSWLLIAEPLKTSLHIACVFLFLKASSVKIAPFNHCLVFRLNNLYRYG